MTSSGVERLVSTAGGDQVAKVGDLFGRSGVAFGHDHLGHETGGFAWALTEQIISSRQPLPISVFETPTA